VDRKEPTEINEYDFPESRKNTNKGETTIRNIGILDNQSGKTIFHDLTASTGDVRDTLLLLGWKSYEGLPGIKLNYRRRMGSIPLPIKDMIRGNGFDRSESVFK